jgi:hypothetical protein
MRILLALVAAAAMAAPSFAANAQLVVMSTNPNGVPAAGTQYLLGIQVSGLSTPTFLGNNLITFSGNLGRNTSVNGSNYNSPNVLFQSEADFANVNDPANYKRTSDSYFAGSWRSALASPTGAGETATTMFLDGGISSAMPALVSNGVTPFAYVNVTGSPGVLITGTLALGLQPFALGAGSGVRLTAAGQLNPQGFAADFAPKNGAVNGGDLAIWKNSFGTNAGGDANLDGDSDGSDFLTWQREFGGVVVPATATNAVVPEPASTALAGGVLGACVAWLRRARLAA